MFKLHRNINACLAVSIVHFVGQLGQLFGRTDQVRVRLAATALCYWRRAVVPCGGVVGKQRVVEPIVVAAAVLHVCIVELCLSAFEDMRGIIT